MVVRSLPLLLCGRGMPAGDNSKQLDLCTECGGFKTPYGTISGTRYLDTQQRYLVAATCDMIQYRPIAVAMIYLVASSVKSPEHPKSIAGGSAAPLGKQEPKP